MIVLATAAKLLVAIVWIGLFADVLREIWEGRS